MIEIKNVDCLEGIKELADGSVDVVKTDVAAGMNITITEL